MVIQPVCCPKLLFSTYSCAKLTTIVDDADEKSLKASNTCSLFFVVLKSFDDVPSLFFTPSIRKPKVAVDEIVSLQTIYLNKKNTFNFFGKFAIDACESTVH